MANLNCLGTVITSQNFVEGDIKFVESLLQFTSEPVRVYHCACYKNVQIKVHKINLAFPPSNCKLWSRTPKDKIRIVYSRTEC